MLAEDVDVSFFRFATSPGTDPHLDVKWTDERGSLDMDMHPGQIAVQLRELLFRNL